MKRKYIALLSVIITILLFAITAFCESLSGDKLSLNESVSNVQTEIQIQSYLYPITTLNSTSYHIGTQNVIRPIINTGITQSGYEFGQYMQVFRNANGTTSDDGGSLYNLSGLYMQYGHYNQNPSTLPNTSNVFGIQLYPYYLTGNITNWYDLYIHSGLGGANITNRYAIYQESPAAINYFAGNLGIGTTSPAAKLEVVSNAYFGGDTANGKSNALVKIAGDTSSTGIQLYANYYFDDNLWGTRIWKEHHGGGIALRIDTQYSNVWHNGIIISHGQQAADPKFGVYGGAVIGSDYSGSYLPPADGLLVQGNVGIGTTNPGIYKLAVEGKIGAREVVVTQAAWADHVFQEDYNLPTLEKVESFIKENKHLPDVPSAKQVEEEGLSMSQMMAKQMQKIEELTLYVIEQNKQLDDLKEKYVTLADENNTLKKRIAGIEEEKN